MRIPWSVCLTLFGLLSTGLTSAFPPSSNLPRISGLTGQGILRHVLACHRGRELYTQTAETGWDKQNLPKRC